MPFEAGFFTFAALHDFEAYFVGDASFETHGAVSFTDFVNEGWVERDLEPTDARRVVVNIIRQAWETYAEQAGFSPHEFSNGTAFTVTRQQIDLNKRIRWGRQGEQRLSVLRNRAKGKVWEYGTSAHASLFPFPHIRLKGRVLFSESEGTGKGPVIDDHKVQHRRRRSVCGAWRNRAWHGRLMAYLELLTGESPYISLRVGGDQDVIVDGSPIQATSPVTAHNTFTLGEDAEEVDATTLGGHFDEEDA